MIFPLIWPKNLTLPSIWLDASVNPAWSEVKTEIIDRETHVKDDIWTGVSCGFSLENSFFSCFPLSYRRVAWNCRHGILWTFLWPQKTSMKELMAFSYRVRRTSTLTILGHQWGICMTGFVPIVGNQCRSETLQGRMNTRDAESQGPKVLQRSVAQQSHAASARSWPDQVWPIPWFPRGEPHNTYRHTGWVPFLWTDLW